MLSLPSGLTNFLRGVDPDTSLVVLAGPTAVGKTGLAMGMAKYLNAEIISADALLFYRGMDIGTAKPSKAEQALIRHWGIDLVDVHERCDVTLYHEKMGEVLREGRSGQRRFIVAGGSGFYVKGFFSTTADPVMIPESIRKEVAQIFEEEGRAGLEKRLRDQFTDDGDEASALIDWNNPRRLMPALERCLATGLSLSQLRERFDLLPEPYPDWKKYFVWLDREDEDLQARIEQRTSAMLASGWIKEVKGLLQTGWRDNPALRQVVGYREIVAHLQGELAESALAQIINKSTWNLVKKQRKFRRQQLPKADLELNLSE